MFQNSMEALVESMPTAVFVLDARGEIAHMNGRARGLLSARRKQTHEALASAIASGGSPSFMIVPFAPTGQSPQHLAIAHDRSSQLDPARIAAAATRWQLTIRQREALELLAQGLGNDAIATRLGCKRSTVEKHLAAIYDAAHVRVRSRSAVLAALAALV